MVKIGVAALLCAILLGPSYAQSLYSNENGTGETICRSVDQQKLETDPSYARELAWDRIVFGDKVHPCGVSLEQFDPGTWERTPLLRATDSEGRDSSFRLYVLDERFSWALGSDSSLEDTENGAAKFRDIFTRRLFLNEFCSADSVVGIGAASHEGTFDANFALADRRARTIAGQLSNIGALCETNTAPPLYELNLGKHKNMSGCTSQTRCATNSSPQRRLVIVAAESVDTGASIEEALKDLLMRTRVINAFAVEDYHSFRVMPYDGTSG